MFFALARPFLEKEIQRVRPGVDYSLVEFKLDQKCTESPFGSCAYDQVNDPWWDRCMFCGEPSMERRFHDDPQTYL